MYVAGSRNSVFQVVSASHAELCKNKKKNILTPNWNQKVGSRGIVSVVCRSSGWFALVRAVSHSERLLLFVAAVS